MFYGCFDLDAVKIEIENTDSDEINGSQFKLLRGHADK